MFDGMPDQFYQFLAAARTATTTTTPSPNSPSPNNHSLSLPLSFSLHNHNHGGSAFTPTFVDPSQGFLSSPPMTHLLHHHHHPPQLALNPTHLQLKHEQDKVEQVALLTSELQQIEDAAWSNDEVLALLRIRSNLDNNWFPDLITWENVSRKLGELGFKRSAEKCKEKFEEETRSFNSSIDINANNHNCSSKNNNNNVTSIQNYRLFGELEDLCNTHHHTQNHPHGVDNNDQVQDQDQDQCPPPQADDQPEQPLPLLSEKNESPPRSKLNDEEEEEEEEEDKAGEKDTGNDKVVVDDEENSVNDSEKTEENTKKRVMRKRKRQNKFDMFKGFCESIVNKMMAQQEQLHCKILEDMIKRDEEKLARELAWKNQHTERIQKEMMVRANDLAIVGHSQAKILAFLNNFTSSNNFSLESQSLVDAIENLLKLQNDQFSTSSIHHESISAQQPTSSSCTTLDQNPSFLLTHNYSPNNIPTSSSNETLNTSKLVLPITSPSIDEAPQNPNEDNNLFRIPSGLSSDHTNTNAADNINTNHRSPEDQTEPKPKPKPGIENGKDDTGRRWPRDEVLALINIRCSLFSNGSNNNNEGQQHESKDQQSSTKGIPLWERISQRMLEMGYKRSAKRCKEKWENINKYFRKTKDLNKKRSIDSRTCPYFHQLSHLYSKGGSVLAMTDRAQEEEGRSADIIITSNGETTKTTTVHGGKSEGSSLVLVSGLDFEF